MTLPSGPHPPKKHRAKLSAAADREATPAREEASDFFICRGSATPISG